LVAMEAVVIEPNASPLTKIDPGCAHRN
jgi:hypothetical protein